jgi:hypothetical protein
MSGTMFFRAWLIFGLVFSLGLPHSTANASRWEIRQEFREGAREVNREKREARREVLRCKTKKCAHREIREGYREVQREKREARREIRREFREHRDDRDDGRDLLKGIAIGAAVIGIAKVVSDAAKDND